MFSTSRFLNNLIRYLLIIVVFTPSAIAQTVSPQNFNLGTPEVQTIWVDVNHGNDSNSGNSSLEALRTVANAWNRIPSDVSLSQGFHLKIKTGTYPESALPNYWENRLGTYNHPIILEAIDGPGTVTFQRDINAFNLNFFYLIGINIFSTGDAFHCEQCNYTLLRKVILDGGNRAAHETLKVNQSQHFYLENSIIRGADDNAVDFVAVQYGHILNNRISNANDWCLYVKGGSAYLTIAGNEIYDCGTGGFTAGQGTGLEFMETPWLHYEAYDIKVFNNIIHHTDGAGLGVNGGYNILLAYNTLYHVGERSHLVEFVFGERSCDGNNSSCNSLVNLGAWGPRSSLMTPQPIPNKNIYFINNIIYNPPGVQSQWQHLAVYGPRTISDESNIPSPARADQNLVIKNNLFWNGSPSMSLGIDDSSGCKNNNSTCNQTQLLSENIFNSVQPEFKNPTLNDFRPQISSNLFSITPLTLPNFSGDDRILTPQTPEGLLNNQISYDRGGTERSVTSSIGAYALSSSSLDADLPSDPTSSDDISISNFRISKRRVTRGSTVRISCQVTGAEISNVWITIGNSRTKQLTLRNNRFRTLIRTKRPGRYALTIYANNSLNEQTLNVGYLHVRNRN